MNKINALIKYELINFKRGLMPWVIVILYFWGGWQNIESATDQGRDLLTLVGLIRFSWIPLNFIMIPLLLFSMNVGKSKNEIFDTIDISGKESILGRISVLLIIDGIIFGINMITAVVVGILCKVSVGYFLYEVLGYGINTIVFLVVTNFVGLFIGRIISRNLGDVVAFIVSISVFIGLCNFYKFSNFIVPLINIRQFTSSFDAINYDKGYFYHNLLWILFAYILYKITFFIEYRKEKVSLFALISTFMFTCAVCVFLVIAIKPLQPSMYDIARAEGDKIIGKRASFCNYDGMYCVEKYKMNIDIDNEFKNTCEMEIRVLKDNVNSIELGLYNKLNITDLQVEGKYFNFTRTKKSFIVKLPREYKNGEIVNLKIDYKGYINVVWYQPQPLFFVRNDALCLGSFFEWYPKQNDGRLKDYKISIKNKRKNKVYSNLEYKNSSEQCKLEGRDKEIVLVSGNIVERQYKGYVFIGNKEYVESDKYCNELMGYIKNKDTTKIKKFIQIPLAYFDSEWYDSAYVHSN